MAVIPITIVIVVLGFGCGWIFNWPLLVLGIVLQYLFHRYLGNTNYHGTSGGMAVGFLWMGGFIFLVGMGVGELARHLSSISNLEQFVTKAFSYLLN